MQKSILYMQKWGGKYFKLENRKMNNLDTKVDLSYRDLIILVGSYQAQAAIQF